MDPWNDAGGSVEPENEAGPSWSGRRESSKENEITNNTSSSSPTFQTSGPVDPWAENSAPIGFNIPSTSYATNDNKSSGEFGNDDEAANSRNDFDPWGGGSVPMTTTTSAHDNIYLNRQTEDEKQDEIEDRRESGWQPADDDRELANKVEDEMHITNNEDEQQHTDPVDEDDPWGSGAQARRANAEANAQRAEIIRLQEEAKGRSSVEQEEERDQEKEADDGEEDDKGAKDDKDKNESTSSSTPATTSTGGWRSFFTRSAAPAEQNNTSRAPSASEKAEAEKSTTPRGSSEIKNVQRDSTTAAPRLWQAPTLRTAHVRTGSNGTQGSGAKESGPASATSPADQGPGWEVQTKKQTGPSGGFIQGLLGSGQNKEGSALSRLGKPLQRPPVVSAQDDDDSGDIEETGLEWDAGDSFDNTSKNKQTKPPPDLLSNDIPQESAVSRLFGRFRGKAASEQEDGKQQEDDLSWLENIGESKGTVSHKPDGDAFNEDDWLAFVGNKPGNATSQSGPSTIVRQIPKAGENFIIPNLAKLSSPKTQPSPLGPPPRIGAPPSHANTSRPVGSTQYASTTSPDPDETFGSFKDVNTLTPNSNTSYRDDPDSYDDALLKSNGQEQQRKKGNFLSSFSVGGRPMKPYTFDDDEEETKDNSWSAFRDVPYEDVGASQYKDAKPSTLPPRSVLPTQQQQQQKQQQSQPIVRSNSAAKNYQAGILPPPPSNQRSVNTNPQTILQSTSRTSTPTPITPSTSKPHAKTLSQGNTLTNDDLSFFENL